MLTEIQRSLLNKLALGDTIVRHYRERIGFYFEASSPAGAELDDIDRTVTLNTLKGLTTKGYLDYDDTGFGRWKRTLKGIIETDDVKAKDLILALLQAELDLEPDNRLLNSYVWGGNESKYEELLRRAIADVKRRSF